MKNNKIKKIFISGILILSWIILTSVYIYSGSNITVITSKLSNSILTKTTFSQFLKGEKITGEFTASQNYFGQLSIRFYNYNRTITDEVIFRIKDINSSSWYYVHTYETNQFLPNSLFPFGFPIISDSKGKTYYFEIESVKGKADNAVTLSRQEPLVTVSFQYPKSLIIKDKNISLAFASNKIKYTEINRDFIVSFLIYVDYVFVSLLLEYLFLAGLLRSKIFSLKNLNSSYLLAIALILLAFSAVLLYLKQTDLSTSVSILGYFILVFGIFWFLVELKKDNSGR